MVDIGRRIGSVFLAGIVALCAVAPASAIEIRSGINSGSTVILPNSRLEIQNLENRVQRQQYQQQQQFQRELDRQSNTQPSQRLEVPQVSPTCQTQVYGQTILRTCR